MTKIYSWCKNYRHYPIVELFHVPDTGDASQVIF